MRKGRNEFEPEVEQMDNSRRLCGPGRNHGLVDRQFIIPAYLQSDFKLGHYLRLGFLWKGGMVWGSGAVFKTN
jgi:hypothetical protein